MAAYGVLFLFLAFFVIPLIWLFFAPSHSSTQELNSNGMRFGSVHAYIEGWHHLLTFANHDQLILVWTINSLLYSAAAVIFATAFGVTAGYALAFFRFPGRRVILGVTMVAMLVPATTLVLPLFLELSRLHIVGSRWAVILPSGFYPLGVFLSYIFFSSHFPKQLLNAARIDGCGEIRLFLQIVLPLTRNVVPLIAFFAFYASWTNYFLPSVLLNNPRTFSLPLGVVDIATATGAIVPTPTAIASVWPIGRPELALAGLYSVLPVIIVFLFSQRFLQQGPLAGAEKT
ncbi:MAG TPA: carbohydrate ABC transporter permease [Gaiellaceae bacterium]|nr:carbohydrate ABC transporter permease [Gaiellaceae bacterium]